MVMGVGPILGDGELLSFERRDGVVVEQIEMRDGRIYSNGMEVTATPEVDERSGTRLPHSPVPVLIGPGTASAAEVTAVAFIGRSDTRLFGELSAGATIGNNGYSLFDGSRLGLAESTYVDRNGGTHIGGIEPDVPVGIQWEGYATARDPLVEAASEWLWTYPECAPSTPLR